MVKNPVLVGYGYRYGEVPLPTPGDIKEGTRIGFKDVDPKDRYPVMTSLGAHVEGFACPHPDMTHVPTIVAGVRKRFACAPPAPNRAMRRRLRTFVRKWLKANLVPLRPDTDLSTDTWLESTNYTQRRKAELRQLDSEVLSLYSDIKKFTTVHSFIKDEVYPEYKHARPINSRHDAFKVKTGPTFKAIEKEVFSLPNFIKKVPVPDRPQYIMDYLYREGSVYYVSDYTAFEANFTQDLMECCEFELYEYMTQLLPNHDEFMSLMRDVIGGRNVCRFKNVRVEINATRMSGEMNTSLGNGFSNLMFMLFVCEEVGCKDVRGVVEGDDGLFALRGVPPTASDFAKLGLMIKPEVHHHLNEASFCGMIFDVEDLVVITDPREVLATTGWGSGKMATRRRADRMALLRCKALSMAHQYAGCPILQEFSRYLLRVTRGFNISRIVNSRMLSGWERDQLFTALHDERGIVEREVKDNSRELVSRRYGISAVDQLAMEAYFRETETLGPLRCEAVLRHMPAVWGHYYDTYVHMPLWREQPHGPWVDLAQVTWDTTTYGRRC